MYGESLTEAVCTLLKMKERMSFHFSLGITFLFFFLPVLSTTEFVGDEMYIDDLQLENFEEERMHDILVELKEPDTTDDVRRSAGELPSGWRKSKWSDSIPKLNLVSQTFHIVKCLLRLTMQLTLFSLIH